MKNYQKLTLSIAIFVTGLGLTFAGSAFAYDSNDSYSHQHITSSWDHGLVCGDHICSAGELPQYPLPVTPVRSH